MNKKLRFILIIILSLISIATLINFIYSFPSMKLSTINKFIILAFILFCFIIFINFLFNKFFNKWWQKTISIIVGLALLFGFYQINTVLFSYNNLLSKMNKNAEITYSTSLIAKKDSAINSVDDINSSTSIGIQDINSYENGAFAKEQIDKLNKTQDIKIYTDIKKAITALNDDKVDLIAIKSLSDATLLSIDKNAKDDYKIITTFEAKQKNSDATKTITDKPFTILISGIDSRSSDVDEVANGDSNIIVTVNTKTGRITTLSTPRDSYVPITCLNNTRDKLTHSAAYGGTECLKSTLENMYDIDIDYTLRINFVGVVDIINSLGGIDINVPVNNLNGSGVKVCEQDSHGDYDAECWIEGKVNHMDGETALAFARNRHNQDGGDFYRGRNQQLVIEAIIKKVTSINSLQTVNKLMSAASKYMSTDLSKNDITTIYESILSNGMNLQIEKLYISGSTGMIGAQSMVFPSETDIAYATYRMDVNLNLDKPQLPSNSYYVLGSTPSNDDGTNPLKEQKMPYDSTKVETISKTSN
ncbi:MAG: LCP family protein [Bacilli bacterium]|jgi:LCP family protein required for cell wall assembly|nr:LCP family protein [Bacilli bacterium]